MGYKVWDGPGVSKEGWWLDPRMCAQGSRDETPGIWFLNASAVTKVTREPGYCLGSQEHTLAQRFVWLCRSPCRGSLPVQPCL